MSAASESLEVLGHESMIVILDANVIVANPFQSGGHWDGLISASKAGAVRVFVPELAIQEAAAVYCRDSDVKISSLRAAARKAPAGAREHILLAASSWEAIRNSYEVELRNRLNFVELLPLPTVAHGELALRAIKRVPPFDSSGGGYRDTLHWYAAMQILESTTPEDDSPGTRAYFVSNDKAAFGAKHHAKLLKELEERTEWDVQFVADLTKVEIPGVFTAERVDLSSMNDESAFHAAVEDALFGAEVDTPQFTRDSYSAVFVSRVDRLDLIALDAQEFFVGRELSIEFEARVYCELQFETMVESVEGGGEHLQVSRSHWSLEVTGSGVSTGNRSRFEPLTLDIASARFLSHRMDSGAT